MIFESHAHYDDEQFDEDREELLASMGKAGIGTIVNASASLKSCEGTLGLVAQYPFIYGALGIHPDEVGELNEETFEWIEKRLDNKKIIAIGEIGLDYYWETQPHDIQEKWFVKQLELARKHDLPVIIHSRDAAEDTLRIMKKHGKGLRGVIHCFSYSTEIAKEYVNMGFYIGIGGVVTFPNARKIKEVVEEISIDNMLLETDCPYLSPAPNRGKRNSSLNLPYIAEEIAHIKKLSYKEVIEQTERNGKSLFKI